MTGPFASGLGSLAFPLILCCAAAVGCARNAPPPGDAPAPIEVPVTVIAAPDINPDPAGRPSPLALRLLVLADAAAFDAASFASLARGDEVPGAARTGEMRLTLRPGEILELPIRIAPTANAIGVFAEYSDPLSASWRARLVVRDPSTGQIAPGWRGVVSLERSQIRTSLMEP